MLLVLTEHISVKNSRPGAGLEPFMQKFGSNSGLELGSSRSLGIENHVTCRAIGLQFVVICNRSDRLKNQFCQTP